jgi:hypothetical protein
MPMRCYRVTGLGLQGSLQGNWLGLQGSLQGNWLGLQGNL